LLRQRLIAVDGPQRGLEAPPHGKREGGEQHRAANDEQRPQPANHAIDHVLSASLPRAVPSSRSASSAASESCSTSANSGCPSHSNCAATGPSGRSPSARACTTGPSSPPASRRRKRSGCGVFSAGWFTAHLFRKSGQRTAASAHRLL